MILPLFALVLSEVAAILLLLFPTPLRKLLLISLDRLKQGNGPVIASTVGATLFVFVLSSIYSLIQIHNRAEDGGILSPTDEVLFANELLEASLLGFAFSLGLMIDRLHYYIKEVRMLRKNLQAAKTPGRRSEDEGKSES